MSFVAGHRQVKDFRKRPPKRAINSLRMETGYDSKHVVSLGLQFLEAKKYTAGGKLALLRELRTRLAALPGVVAVSIARPPGDNLFRTAAAADREKSTAQNVQSIHYAYVQANYFRTLGIPLFLGRGFQPHDGQPERSVILSESAAKQLWPGRNPIGRSLRLGAIDEQLHYGIEDRSELLAEVRPTRSPASFATRAAPSLTAATRGRSTCRYPTTGFRIARYLSGPIPPRRSSSERSTRRSRP
jgi:hypothetical protein